MDKQTPDDLASVEGYLDAEQVLSRDPLDFRDKDKDRVDDRLENKDQV